MKQRRWYPIAKPVGMLCHMFNLSPTLVLRKAGLAPDVLLPGHKGVSAAEYFAAFEAIFQLVGNPALPLTLGQSMAHEYMEPPLYAFSCSRNIEAGWRRLAVFKPLVAPFQLRVTTGRDYVELGIAPSDPGLRTPDALALFDLVYFTEVARAYTGHHIVPLEIGAPAAMIGVDGLDSFFGMTPKPSDLPTLRLSLADARRRLISENEDLWASFEGELTRKLLAGEPDNSLSGRVREALMELMPAGQATVAAVCGKLHMSRRSLQRRLAEEGETFQNLLDNSRSDLARHYLQSGDLSVEEISYLLAYRDPNSFYRAFNGWTGMTPMQMRSQATA